MNNNGNHGEFVNSVYRAYYLMFIGKTANGRPIYIYNELDYEIDNRFGFATKGNARRCVLMDGNLIEFNCGWSYCFKWKHPESNGLAFKRYERFKTGNVKMWTWRIRESSKPLYCHVVTSKDFRQKDKIVFCQDKHYQPKNTKFFMAIPLGIIKEDRYPTDEITQETEEEEEELTAEQEKIWNEFVEIDLNE